MAKGKWDHLRDKYRRMPIEASYQQRIDAVLDSPAPTRFRDPLRVEALGLETVKDLETDELKNMYVWLRRRKDNLDAKAKAIDLEITALTREFVDRFEEEGERSKEFMDGVQLGHSVEPYPVITDKTALNAWIKAQGMEDMLTLNYQTASSLVKERLEGKVDEPLPPGLDVYLKDKLTCRGRPKD